MNKGIANSKKSTNFFIVYGVNIKSSFCVRFFLAQIADGELGNYS